ncbi:MAG: TetR family transcriptional regulator C-terminal domain-containing protein [Rhodospirillales bacterium]
MQRLRRYIDANVDRLNRDAMRHGCLFGNFSAEAVEQSEPIRRRIVEIFAEVQQAIAYCLSAAVAAGELPAKFDCEEVAWFVLSSLQGAILLAKAETQPGAGGAV